MLLIGVVILLAYVIGSIPTAVWVGKVFFKLDVREHGSKNAGATNAIRVFGWKAGLPVFLFDVFKGWLAVMLAVFLHSEMLTQEQIVFLQIATAAAVYLVMSFLFLPDFGAEKVLQPSSVLVLLYSHSQFG